MRKITNEELGRPSAGEFARMEKMPVAVVLDNVRSMQNVGAFFRTADAFAVGRMRRPGSEQLVEQGRDGHAAGGQHEGIAPLAAVAAHGRDLVHGVHGHLSLIHISEPTRPY